MNFKGSSLRVTSPDFYIASSDDIAFEDPRRCWRLRRLKASNRSDDLLVVVVDPAIPGGPYAFATQMDLVVIASRLEGVTHSFR